MSLEDRLSRSLRERSADAPLGGTDLDAVRASAATIRRRTRTRALVLSATATALLVVLAGGAWGWVAAPWSAERRALPATEPGPSGLRDEPVRDIAELEGTWYFLRAHGEAITERVGFVVRDTDEGWWWGGPADECHGTGGPAWISGSGTLVLTATVPVPMNFCGPDGQTAAAAATIGAAETVRLLSGDPERMVWLSGDEELALLERGEDPGLAAEQLAGRWTVELIDGATAARGQADVEWPLVITLDYDEERTDPSGAATSPLWFSARFDCNTASGPVIAREGSFAASVEITTQVACAANDFGGSDIRARFLQADSWRYPTGDPTRLELLRDDVVVLTLRRAKLPLTGSP
jgi:hypothetical protein